MTLRSWLARLREMIAPGSERDLDEELRLHRDLLVERYQRDGLSADEARRRATLTLGGLDQGKEQIRDERGFPSLEALGRDLAYATRQLIKSPTFTLVTVLTLALGIGINVAIFSIVDAVVLRPLPYPEAERLISIWETGGESRMTVAAGNLADYRQAPSVPEMAAFASQARNITGEAPPETVYAEEVTDNYFRVLRVTPAMGRDFNDADTQPNGRRVAILSDGLWQRRFNADRAIIGTLITLDGTPHEIIAVMPPDFRGVFDLIAPDRRDLWLPARYPPELLANRGDHGLRLVGRLADEATVEGARAELEAISSALAQQYPATNEKVRTGVQPLRDDLVRNVRTSLIVLLATVAIILSIACVNIANLFLARGVNRRRDVALRYALGASRARVVTSLVAESLVLAAAAAVVGGVVATWMTRALIATAPTDTPRLDTVGMDARVVAYTALVAVGTGLLFGVIPAWQAGHSRPLDALAGSGRVVAGRAVMRWRSALMIAQIALSAVLLVGAGLMVKSLSRLNSVALGFDAAHVLAMRIILPESRYPTGDARLQFYQRLEARVAQIPGVQSVGYANNLPLRGGWSGGFAIDGEPLPDSGSLQADFQAVSTGYFQTLGITLSRGRLFSESDRSGAPPAAVVSRLFETRFLRGENAIGRQIRRGPTAAPITIVGVVDDVRRDGRTSVLNPQVYLSAAQTVVYPVRLADLAIRSELPPAALMSAVRDAVSGLDPEQSVTQVRTLDDILLAGSASRRFQALLFSLFALLALVLASVGTYGVVSYVVSQRTPEIGVRLALGATAWGIYRWLLGHTALVVVTGAAAGLLAARWLGRYVATMLFDVAVGDPASYALAAAMLVTVALAASLLAGLRAVRVDPATALRYE